jgi:hypothetical protein
MNTNRAEKGIAIVTGASSGIGYELAKCAASEGYDLVIAADEPEIGQAAATLRGMGVTVEAVEADLARLEGVERLVDRVQATNRPVDLLMANEAADSARVSSTRTLPKRGGWWIPTSPARSTWPSASAISCAARGTGASCSPARSPASCRAPIRPSTMLRKRSSTASPSRCERNSRVRASASAA